MSYIGISLSSTALSTVNTEMSKHRNMLSGLLNWKIIAK
jgi:hypothetical protein